MNGSIFEKIDPTKLQPVEGEQGEKIFKQLEGSGGDITLVIRHSESFYSQAHREYLYPIVANYKNRPNSPNVCQTAVYTQTEIKQRFPGLLDEERSAQGKLVFRDELGRV